MPQIMTSYDLIPKRPSFAAFFTLDVNNLPLDVVSKQVSRVSARQLQKAEDAFDRVAAGLLLMGRCALAAHAAGPCLPVTHSRSQAQLATQTAGSSLKLADLTPLVDCC